MTNGKRAAPRESGLCWKGRHLMTADNVSWRGNARSCRTCYNERLRVYMQGVRDRKKQQKEVTQ